MTTSTPIYTATAGPTDPNAGTRAKVYSGLALLTPLLSFLATFGVFTSDQSNALIGVSTAVVGALSAFGFGFAAKKTNEQNHNGTFDPAPPPVVVAPVDQPLESLITIQKAANDAVDQVQERVADGINFIQSAVSLIPGGAPANVGGLLPGLAELADLMKSRPAPATPKHQAE